MSQQHPHDPTQPYVTGTQYQQPAPPKRHTARTVFLTILAAGIFLFGGCGIIVASIGGSPAQDSTASSKPLGSTAPTTEAAATTTAPKTTEPAAPAYAKPAKGDFKLTPKILTKHCFGSAGCNVTYRIIISYTGPTIDPDKSYEVVYEVRGGEDGPTTNTFTVSGDQSSVDEEELISTKSRASKLTAVATDVL